MSDPYKSGMFQSSPYMLKRTVDGSLAAILGGRFENRGLQLIEQVSRALKKNEVHELIVSDEPGIGPGARVEKIAYIGFVEIERGGVVIEGDEVFFENTQLGVVAGFDETHMPNHQNIVLCGERISGAERTLPLEGRIRFVHARR